MSFMIYQPPEAKGPPHKASVIRQWDPKINRNLLQLALMMFSMKFMILGRR